MLLRYLQRPTLPALKGAGRDSFNLLCLFWLLLTAVVGSTSAEEKDPMLLHDAEGLRVRAHFQAGLNLVGEQHLFWDLAETTAPDSGFDSDTEWIEGYVKPGLSFERAFASSVFYGKLSGVVSGTLGTDSYDAFDTGRGTLEEAFLGFKARPADVFDLDVSVGARELKLGTGMQIANGASSGFERGALKFGPRKAWERAAIVRLAKDGLAGTLFYLDPNELSSNDTGNELAGVDLRHDGADGGFLGLTYLHILESESPYPQAAPGGMGPPIILEGGRDGLHGVSLYARTRPLQGALRDVFVTLDLAYQWHDRIDVESHAGRLKIGRTFQGPAWKPLLTYWYQTFSGDDPNTPELERFDPLFYEGSPSAWSTGTKSSMVFINSNVQAHNIALRLQPTAKDTVTFYYAHIRVDELLSPIQFGQATRVEFGDGVPTVISGVTDAHLSDDIFIEYSRIINQNTYLTSGFSIGFPGEGIETTVRGNTPDWIGGFVNVVVNF